GSPALTPLDPSVAGIAVTGVSGRGGRLRAPQDSREPAPGTRIAGPGVVGLGSTAKDPPLRDTAACGVFGVGAPAIDSRDHKVGGTGVFGQAGEKSTGETNNGAGVIGVSGTLNYSELEAAEKGVLGVSTNGTGVAGNGAITGVHGVSNASAGQGVYGHGKPGRGGVFESARDPQGPIAQIRLVPQRAAFGRQPQPIVPVNPDGVLETEQIQQALPKDGRTGDLFAVEIVSEVTLVPVGTLWFCVQGARQGTQALWSQVLMGPPVRGRG